MVVYAVADVSSAFAVEDELAGGELTWQTSSLAVASMLRMCRASGSNVRAEISGSTTRGANGRSRSVAARRISRRRPSGKATAT
ncbi:MAG: hypothetical protein JOZ17_26540 [Acetobacteraceae bacterium]|nr:hypothetical protein [Acetobacteraceae bacterium]